MNINKGFAIIDLIVMGFIGIITFYVFSRLYNTVIYPFANELLSPVSGSISYYWFVMFFFSLVPTVVIVFIIAGLIQSIRKNQYE